MDNLAKKNILYSVPLKLDIWYCGGTGGNTDVPTKGVFDGSMAKLTHKFYLNLSNNS